jgi:outer membrane biosynthesis protein TonB
VAAVILLFCGALFGSIRLLRSSRGSVARTPTSAEASAPKHESFATVGEIGSPVLSEKRTGSTPEKISGGRLIQRPAPVFPAIALQSRMRGTVKAFVFVSGRGTVSLVEVTEGPTLLADATVAALSQWRFAPFFVEGNASGVAVRVPVTIEFEPSTAASAR